MAAYKNQLIMKYCSKCLVSNICHINFIIYIKIYHCEHSGLDFLLRNINNNWYIQGFN